ncbi:Uncharacterised protein [Bordetella pertussis]|nr:Uncharacterised protein [Bordetella pertussis]CFW43123.1 Uncharacterised protein [Bordetella pertussis]
MANTWYSGSALMIVNCRPCRSCSTGCATASVCSTLATRLPCDSMAPLGTPVVPPVYCSTARSSMPSAGGVNVARAPSRKASGRRCAPSMRHGGINFFT